jgi:hypothetical protein
VSVAQMPRAIDMPLRRATAEVVVRKRPVPGCRSKLCIDGTHVRCFMLRCSCDCHKGGVR